MPNLLRINLTIMGFFFAALYYVMAVFLWVSFAKSWWGTFDLIYFIVLGDATLIMTIRHRRVMRELRARLDAMRSRYTRIASEYDDQDF